MNAPTTGTRGRRTTVVIIAGAALAGLLAIWVLVAVLGIVEAPTMLGAGGQYYLVYSGNDWDTASYAISYAVCSSPLGPCTKPNPGPWLTSTSTAKGPGSPSVFTDEEGNTWLALHSWGRGPVGYPDGARSLFVVRFTLVNGTPALNWRSGEIACVRMDL